MNQTMKKLEKIKALDIPSDTITKLGNGLNNFGLDPQLAKIIIYATMFGCQQPVISIISAHMAFAQWIGFGMRGSLKHYMQQIPGAHNESYVFLLLKIFNEYRKFTNSGGGSHRDRGYSRTSRNEHRQASDSVLPDEVWKKIINPSLLKTMVRTSDDLNRRAGRMFGYHRSFNRNNCDLRIIEEVISSALCPNVVCDIGTQLCGGSCFCLDTRGRNCQTGVGVHVNKATARCKKMEKKLKKSSFFLTEVSNALHCPKHVLQPKRGLLYLFHDDESQK